MKEVVLYINPDRDVGMTVSNMVRNMLSGMGVPYRVCMYPLGIGGAPEEVSMVITFGGDGTILHCARSVAGKGIPILGVNMGN